MTWCILVCGGQLRPSMRASRLIFNLDLHSHLVLWVLDWLNTCSWNEQLETRREEIMYPQFAGTSTRTSTDTFSPSTTISISQVDEGKLCVIVSIELAPVVAHNSSHTRTLSFPSCFLLAYGSSFHLSAPFLSICCLTFTCHSRPCFCPCATIH